MEDEINELPCSLETEIGLLGCIIAQNKVISHIQFLDERHFYSSVHAAIFTAMNALFSNGQPVTPYTVKLDAKSLELLKDEGGIVKYLSRAAMQSSWMIRPIEHAKLLVELAKKRELITACQRTITSASDEADHKSADEHAAVLHSDVEAILRGFGIPDLEDDYAITEAILTDLKDERKPFSTGLPKLDEAMGGGLYSGRSYGFAARKKVGKTVLASTISCNLNEQGVRHLFICGEMSPKEIHQRNLARLTDSFPSAFRTSYGQTNAFQNAIADVATKSNRCILYHNAPGLTFGDLKRVASSAVYRHGIKGIILDYWQLVLGKGKGQSTAEHLDEVAQWMANFGRKHGIWTISMAQINQEGNTRGGEGIRLAFDQVYQINREDITMPQTWIEMMDTRYTAWMNIGSADFAGLMMHEKGPYFA